MNIMHIYQGDYPWDVRVEKINDSLLEQGHNVFLVCRNLTRRPLVEKNGNLTICRLPYLPEKFGRANSIVSFQFPYNPLWSRHVERICGNKGIDLIIVRDLPLALLAIRIGKKKNIPVIMDMAENYSCMYEAGLMFNKYSLKNYLIKNPAIAKWVERKVFGDIHKTIVVIEESKDRIIRLGMNKDDVLIIRNTPSDSFVKSNYVSLPDDDFYHDASSIRIVYNGLVNHSRGVHRLVTQMPLLLKRFPTLKFIIIGEGSDDKKIREIISELGLESSVKHKGWVSHEDKLKYIKHAHIGVMPYFISPHWNTTIPNKIFDYMSMGIPVLCTEVVPSARIVHECRCGLVYRGNDTDDLSAKIELMQDTSRRRYYGENGRKAIQEKYNWKNDFASLPLVINELSAWKNKQSK